MIRCSRPAVIILIFSAPCEQLSEMKLFLSTECAQGENSVLMSRQVDHGLMRVCADSLLNSSVGVFRLVSSISDFSVLTRPIGLVGCAPANNKKPLFTGAHLRDVNESIKSFFLLAPSSNKNTTMASRFTCDSMRPSSHVVVRLTMLLPARVCLF